MRMTVSQLRVERLLDAPIVAPYSDASIGTNIQGPSLIRVPDWIPDPLGRYYLYFADHKGQYIRLAYADSLTGPWRIHVPGTLQLGDSHFPTEPLTADPGEVARLEARRKAAGARPMEHDLLTEITTPHIASPDVHVDESARRVVMYFHGLESLARQVSRVAVSSDGIAFEAKPEVLGRTYMRIFRWRGATYALAMPGLIYRSADGLTGFEAGPTLFNPDMRHSAVLQREDQLFVFWTQVGDSPERILLSTIDLSPDWQDWRETEPVEVMRPERPWEGADQPVEPSVRSVAYRPVNQLRDPAVFVEGDDVYLAYAVAGEAGIGLARVWLPD